MAFAPAQKWLLHPFAAGGLENCRGTREIGGVRGMHLNSVWGRM